VREEGTADHVTREVGTKRRTSDEKEGAREVAVAGRRLRKGRATGMS
jgi:hypothetical protein